MKGLEWSVLDAKQNIRRSVANMSLGSRKSRAKNEIVRAAVNAGLVVVVASGNQTVSSQVLPFFIASRSCRFGFLAKRDPDGRV